MYNLLEDRNKSSNHFLKFLKYMISERNQINGMDDQFKNDFIYNYNNLPQFFEDFIKRNEQGTLRQLAIINIAINRIKEDMEN